MPDFLPRIPTTRGVCAATGKQPDGEPTPPKLPPLVRESPTASPDSVVAIYPGIEGSGSGLQLKADLIDRWTGC